MKSKKESIEDISSTLSQIQYKKDSPIDLTDIDWTKSKWEMPIQYKRKIAKLSAQLLKDKIECQISIELADKLEDLLADHECQDQDHNKNQILARTLAITSIYKENALKSLSLLPFVTLPYEYSDPRVKVVLTNAAYKSFEGGKLVAGTEYYTILVHWDLYYREINTHFIFDSKYELGPVIYRQGDKERVAQHLKYFEDKKNEK